MNRSFVIRELDAFLGPAAVFGVSFNPQIPASEFLAQVGATSFTFLPNSKAIVLRFEDRERFADLSDTYDSFPTQRELAAEFFCRVMNTVVEDVYLSALYPTEEQTGG